MPRSSVWYVWHYVWNYNARPDWLSGSAYVNSYEIVQPAFFQLCGRNRRDVINDRSFFFFQWETQACILGKNPSSPIRSRIYDLPISSIPSSDALWELMLLRYFIHVTNLLHTGSIWNSKSGIFESNVITKFPRVSSSSVVKENKKSWQKRLCNLPSLRAEILKTVVVDYLKSRSRI